MSEEIPAVPSPPPIPPAKKGFSARPDTSGTQLNLRANREKASSAFKISREQERIYITKRQAGFGKQEAVKAKEHLQTAQKNLYAGVTCTWHAAANLPAIIKEKRVDQKQQKKIKRMEREEEAKKNLEKIAAAINSTEEAAPAAG
ncbi:hypothetical protein OnM2_080037 [Erysiphe neolycopersici]|uniref:Uncharacterized protein n=1 Tax=Erysiphe neolycopersici TaxID=212602 RepID=A0A420HGJ7_9PEZI|nr:hypothetical protein OnM2_080037 [Erysiphe neolycopersici]